MLTYLSELSYAFGPFNLFRYITFRAGGATATALFFVFFFGPGIISRLRLKQGKGQPIREDGPASHLLTKKGTPTMGGLMILSGLVVATVLWANPRSAYVWIVMFVTLGFGAIGFYDDYLKVTKQTHDGFSGRARLAIETGMWSVYEWEEGEYKYQYRPKEYKPVSEYMKHQKRFSHLTAEHIAKMQAFIDAKVKAPGVPVKVPVQGPRQES